MSNLTVNVLSVPHGLILHVLQAIASFPELQCGEGGYFHTVDNGTDDGMDLAISRGICRSESLLERCSESRRCLFSKGLQRRSGEGRSRRLAQGAGQAAASRSAVHSCHSSSSLAQQRRCTYVLSMFADDLKGWSGEKSG